MVRERFLGRVEQISKFRVEEVLWRTDRFVQNEVEEEVASPLGSTSIGAHAERH
jgi:hypothetical protein